MTEPTRSQRAAQLAGRRRFGASEATRERIHQSFAEADDLRGQCRHCGHVRHGTLADITGECPACGAGVANAHSD